MLSLKNLSVSINDTAILHDITLDIVPGKNYCLLGKNGSGKSSLTNAIMGHPHMTITEGTVTIDDDDLLKMSVDERAKRGIFLAFQSIPEISGIKVFEFLRSMYHAYTGDNIGFVPFKKKIFPLADAIGFDHELLWRDLNVGFSGGERRKLEVLQIKLINPTYIFLDEIDSGLDVDAFHMIASMLGTVSSPSVSIVVITHIFGIIDYISIDHVCVLEKGKIVKQGAKDIAIQIRDNGFSGIEE